MKQITLLGDSIFDNKSYVGDGKDTITHLRERMKKRGDGSDAVLAAVDGAVAAGVASQLRNVSPETTHLIVSIGGNDALGETGVLDMKVSSNADVFNDLADRTATFEDRYKRMIDMILGLKKPTALCTVYYPRMEQAVYQKLAVAALASFNDVIIRQAFLNGLPLIDLRFVCNEDADYANAIEPRISPCCLNLPTKSLVTFAASFESPLVAKSSITSAFKITSSISVLMPSAISR